MPIPYAPLITATILGILGPPEKNPVEETDKYDIGIRVGRNEPEKHGPGKNGILSLEVASRRPLFYGIKPCAALGLGDGAAYATACLAKPYHFGAFTLTPSFGPTLFVSGRGTSELLQFRTSVELQVKLQKDWKAGVGFYHISNGNIAKHSAGIDVFFASVQASF